MKTYVITLSQYFPATHPRKGQPTGFAENVAFKTHLELDKTIGGYRIVQGSKRHTIRANYPLWAKRFEQIERGEACLSIRQWSGKPYASKQLEIARLAKEDGIGLQKLIYQKENRLSPARYTIEDCEIDTSMLAENDGLTLSDWEAWFSNPKYDLSKPLAIIHFTKFRY